MRRSLFITILIALVFISNAFSQKIKPVNPGVTASFTYCAANDFACQAANRVRMDGDIPYNNGQSGVTAVFNLVSGSRDLTIQLNTSQRLVIFDLIEMTSGVNAPSWISTPQGVRPNINVLGAYYAKENCQPAPVTGNYNCNFVTRMNAGNWKVNNNTTNALLWNPETTQQRPVNSPENTSNVNVNYIKDETGEVFIITPLPNSASNRIIAGLEASNGKVVSGAGQYSMPFTLTVHVK